MNPVAELLDDEDAAAVTTWTMSSTPRVFGSIKISFVNVLAIPPVDVEKSTFARDFTY